MSCQREVVSAGWSLAADGREACFEITAGSFLHNMVRVAVGSMVDVAQGRMDLAAFGAGLAGGQRRDLGRTAPARGLARSRSTTERDFSSAPRPTIGGLEIVAVVFAALAGLYSIVTTEQMTLRSGGRPR